MPEPLDVAAKATKKLSSAPKQICKSGSSAKATQPITSKSTAKAPQSKPERTDVSGLCVHCGELPSRVSYDLCRKCYDSMPLLERRQLDRRPLRRAPAEWLTATIDNKPAEPTSARPCTAEKVEVMCQRAAALENLHHHDDAGVKTIKPVNYELAYMEMCMRYDAPKGIERRKNRWRARPWWGYERFHLGYFTHQHEAIAAAREWKILAGEIGPQKAMLKIRAASRAGQQAKANGKLTGCR